MWKPPYIYIYIDMDDEASEFLSSIQMGDHGQATNDLDSDQREIMELVSSHYIIIYIYVVRLSTCYSTILHHSNSYIIFHYIVIFHNIPSNSIVSHCIHVLALGKPSNKSGNFPANHVRLLGG